MERIAVAEFRARNIKENPMATTYLEQEGDFYYYIASNGGRGHKYKTLDEAKEDIKDLWGGWYDFKLLV